MQKCWPMCFLFTHLPEKGNYFGKLNNITLAYLLSPSILQHLKQILKQSCIILAQIGPKLSILPKRCILGKLTITFVCLLCSILQQHFKKNWRANHHKRLHNFDWNWAWPCPPKGNFLEQLVNIALVFHIPLSYIISKKILREQIARLHDFCPNFPLPQKRIFLENWLLLLISNNWTPLC